MIGQFLTTFQPSRVALEILRGKRVNTCRFLVALPIRSFKIMDHYLTKKSLPNQENEPKPCVPEFYVYIFHLLFGLALPMILFSTETDFPTEIVCRLPPSNLSIPDFASGSNFTTIECKRTLG